MISAARKLQGIGLLALVTICALLAYPVSLQVASTRSELRRVENDIRATRERIRLVEGEISVLASFSQLERWNGETFGLVAPRAAQFLPNERALAGLDRLRAPVDAQDRAPVLVALPQNVPVRTANVPEPDTRRRGTDNAAVAMVRDIAGANSTRPAALPAASPNPASAPPGQSRRTSVALAAMEAR